MEIYNSELKRIIGLIGHDNTTTNTDLDRIGKKLFRRKYVGTFASDRLPTLSEDRNFCIINVDTTGMPGSHWVACCYDAKRDDILVYDSFGRDTKKLLPHLQSQTRKDIYDSQYDPEQRTEENSCGQRSLSFISVFDKLGWDYAVLI